MRFFTEIPQLELSSIAAQAFAHDGITAPTSVQRAVIPEILMGKHVVIHSPTGTGKTLAYLLPVLQRMARDPKARTVIMAPGAELVMQIVEVAKRYATSDITIGALVGVSSIIKSTRLVVGTPGKILDLYARRKIKGVTTMVLDEPDSILGGRDGDFLREVLSRPEPKVQVIVAAATIGPYTEQLVQEVMSKNLARPIVAQSGPPSIAHHVVGIGQGAAKDVILARFIKANQCKRAVIFASEDPTIAHLQRLLSRDGTHVVILGGTQSKQERRASLQRFASGDAQILITHDGAARGLDIEGVEWVLHYDIPHSAPAYLHRAGRTGRAQRKGTSVVFATGPEWNIMERFGRKVDIPFTPFNPKPTHKP